MDIGSGARARCIGDFNSGKFWRSSHGRGHMQSHWKLVLHRCFAVCAVQGVLRNAAKCVETSFAHVFCVLIGAGRVAER